MGRVVLIAMKARTSIINIVLRTIRMKVVLVVFQLAFLAAVNVEAGVTGDRVTNRWMDCWDYGYDTPYLAAAYNTVAMVSNFFGWAYDTNLGCGWNYQCLDSTYSSGWHGYDTNGAGDSYSYGNGGGGSVAK